MNFFGHALTASWHSRGPGFALGAMLPDFASMVGLRIEGAEDAETAAGIAFHHETDRVFHQLEPFARGSIAIAGELRARGVSRGPARGVGHIGFELCLDGALLDEPGAAAAYLAALAAGADRAIERGLRWSEPEGAAAWRSLCQRLLAHGVPVDYGVPARVAERVERILAGRPLLALRPAEAAAVAAAMPGVASLVAEAAPAVVAQLRAELL